MTTPLIESQMIYFPLYGKSTPTTTMKFVFLVLKIRETFKDEYEILKAEKAKVK